MVIETDRTILGMSSPLAEDLVAGDRNLVTGAGRHASYKDELGDPLQSPVKIAAVYCSGYNSLGFEYFVKHTFDAAQQTSLLPQPQSRLVTRCWWPDRVHELNMNLQMFSDVCDIMVNSHKQKITSAAILPGSAMSPRICLRVSSEVLREDDGRTQENCKHDF